MQIAVPEATKPQARHSRTRLFLVIVAVTFALLGVAAVAVWDHYKIALFNDYRAGFAAAAAQGHTGAASTDSPCLSAVHTAYPGQSMDGQLPENVTAFLAGCSDRLQGRTSDPWRLHNYMHL
jgi:hypothetical protein